MLQPKSRPQTIIYKASLSSYHFRLCDADAYILTWCFSAQVAVSTNKEVDAHIPNYPSLPPQLICQLHNLTMHV